MRREHHVDYVQEPAVLDKDDSLAMSNLLEKNERRNAKGALSPFQYTSHCSPIYSS